MCFSNLYGVILCSIMAATTRMHSLWPVMPNGVLSAPSASYRRQVVGEVCARSVATFDVVLSSSPTAPYTLFLPPLPDPSPTRVRRLCVPVRLYVGWRLDLFLDRPVALILTASAVWWVACGRFGARSGAVLVELVSQIETAYLSRGTLVPCLMSLFLLALFLSFVPSCLVTKVL
jgi:hypothetical protein